ncbi:MAG: hypothetical protein KDC46_09625, partial [Thermoleophilia bacterium]|nr:hypothetical protein [Thermoleophilia bacterium]
MPWAAALLSVMFLTSGAFVDLPNGVERGYAQRLATMATAEDGASHLSIMEGVLASGGFAYGDTGRAASAQSQYPPGFHLVAAALSRSFDDTAGSTDFR